MRSLRLNEYVHAFGHVWRSMLVVTMDGGSVTNWMAGQGWSASISGGTQPATYWRIASSEPASYTLSSSLPFASIICVAYRGSDLSSPIRVEADASGTGTTATGASVSGIVGDRLATIIQTTGSASITGTPSGMTTRENIPFVGSSHFALALWDSNGPFQVAQPARSRRRWLRALVGRL